MRGGASSGVRLAGRWSKRPSLPSWLLCHLPAHAAACCAACSAGSGLGQVRVPADTFACACLRSKRSRAHCNCHWIYGWAKTGATGKVTVAAPRPDGRDAWLPADAAPLAVLAPRAGVSGRGAQLVLKKKEGEDGTVCFSIRASICANASECHVPFGMRCGAASRACKGGVWSWRFVSGLMARGASRSRAQAQLPTIARISIRAPALVSTASTVPVRLTAVLR